MEQQLLVTMRKNVVTGKEEWYYTKNYDRLIQNFSLNHVSIIESLNEIKEKYKFYKDIVVESGGEGFGFTCIKYKEVNGIRLKILLFPVKKDFNLYIKAYTKRI